MKKQSRVEVIIEEKAEPKNITVLSDLKRPKCLAAVCYEPGEEALDQSPLSEEETTTLNTWEAIIKQGKAAFLEVGQALGEIKALRLYRENFTSFEDYCRSKWGFGRTQAYRYIGAARTHREILDVAHGEAVALPATEREIRPLINLDAQQRSQVLSRASQLAGTKRRTSKHIDQAVEEIKAAENPPENIVMAIPMKPLQFSGGVSAIVTPADLRDSMKSLGELLEYGKTSQHVLSAFATLEKMLEHYLAAGSAAVEVRSQNN